MTSIINNTFSRELRISSVQRISESDSITNFNVNLSRMTETNNIVRIVCKAVSFPNNVYNIQSPNNKFVLFVENTEPINFFKIEIPEGFYNSTLIRSTIEGLLNPLLAPYSTVISIDQNNVDGKMIITSSNELIRVVTNPELESELSLYLGFVGNYDLSLSNLAVYQPSLQGLVEAYVHCFELGEGNYVDGDVENHDIICKVPVNVPYGRYVNYELNDNELNSINFEVPRNFDNIRIQLKDINDNLIKLNGGIFTIIVKLYYL